MFPAIVYRKPGTHPCKGGTYDYMGVEDEAALKSAQAAGWSLDHPDGSVAADMSSVNEAIESLGADEPPTREELEQKAKELGIKINKKMTDEELLELINIELEG